MKLVDDIRWLDGKPATGKFILRIDYDNGSCGFLKNDNIDKIKEYHRILFDCPEVVKMTVYNPQGSVQNEYKKVA